MLFFIFDYKSMVEGMEEVEDRFGGDLALCSQIARLLLNGLMVQARIECGYQNHELRTRSSTRFV